MDRRTRAHSILGETPSPLIGGVTRGSQLRQSKCSHSQFRLLKMHACFIIYTFIRYTPIKVHAHKVHGGKMHASKVHGCEVHACRVRQTDRQARTLVGRLAHSKFEFLNSIEYNSN